MWGKIVEKGLVIMFKIIDSLLKGQRTLCQGITWTKLMIWKAMHQLVNLFYLPWFTL